jgi:hypothetical protein
MSLSLGPRARLKPARPPLMFFVVSEDLVD